MLADPALASAGPTTVPAGPTTVLSGWGRTAPTAAHLVGASDMRSVGRLIDAGSPRGVIARGLGRSYNDAAQNAGGVVVDATGPATTGDDAVVLDPERGIARVAAGVSLERLMFEALPHGWFVPVTPGTRQVTVGGAIAADVHGKNHHRHGAFGAHVRALTLVDGIGTERQLSWDDTPAEMAATVGGMGLTGVIVDADVQLIAAASSRLIVDTDRAADLDTLMALMSATDAERTYSVAWIDLLASGHSTGRGVLTRGDIAEVDQLAAADRPDPLDWSPGRAVPAPPWMPPRLLNRLSIRAFNEAWYRAAPRRRRDEIQSIGRFFHPLDGVRSWNRLYGRPGFVQWQCVVPLAASEVICRIVAALSAARCPSFLAVLKRFGPAGAGHLSFPMPGWTLALDVPTAVPGLGTLLDELDADVLGAGGRLYLAKDARVRPELIPDMYPRLEEWREVRDRLDPDGVMVSDLDRRLDLSGRRR